MQANPLLTYLISKLAVLEQPQLVLPFQVVSVNVAEIHLKQTKINPTSTLVAFDFSCVCDYNLSLHDLPRVL